MAKRPTRTEQIKRKSAKAAARHREHGKTMAELQKRIKRGEITAGNAFLSLGKPRN